MDGFWIILVAFAVLCLLFWAAGVYLIWDDQQRNHRVHQDFRRLVNYAPILGVALALGGLANLYL